MRRQFGLFGPDFSEKGGCDKKGLNSPGQSGQKRPELCYLNKFALTYLNKLALRYLNKLTLRYLNEFTLRYVNKFALTIPGYVRMLESSSQFSVTKW